MDEKSLTPQEIKLQQLKEILPEAFAEEKVDWEKLKATLGEDINFANERYVLNWAGKSEAFKILQAPTTKTLIPNKKESVNFNDTEHIFIESENLEALKILQKSYFGKIKMIYIDPPYNTGNDSFIYSDKFSETKAEYEKRIGDKDEKGYLTKDGFFRKNSKENGQYHSNWLNMMYPRLFLAKNLLKQDGVIFISIDDNEVHNLRLLMNEVFGEENFEGHIHWRRRHNQPNDKTKMIGLVAEHIICYAKSSVDLKILGVGKLPVTGKFSNPDNDPKGDWASKPWKVGSDQSGSEYTIITPTGISFTEEWMGEKNTYKKLLIDNRIIFTKNEDGLPRKKYYKFEREEEGQSATNWWTHEIFGHNQEGNDELTSIFNGKKNIFSNPKPARLIKALCQIAKVESKDIVLDYFAGSGSLGDCMFKYFEELNGKFILIQLPELTDKKSEAHKAGYKTIADIAKERIRRAGKKIQKEINNKIKSKRKDIKALESQLDIDGKEEKIKNLKNEIKKLKKQDLGFKVLKLQKSNFKQWQQIQDNDALRLEKQMELFVDPISENATIENMVYELLLKSGKDLNSKLEHKENYYCVNGNELILMLKKASQEIVDAVIKEKPQKVVALDRLFKGNDQLKTNTSLQMKDAEIEFKTI